jgi:hypothetical protein
MWFSRSLCFSNLLCLPWGLTTKSSLTIYFAFITCYGGPMTGDWRLIPSAPLTGYSELGVFLPQVTAPVRIPIAVLPCFSSMCQELQILPALQTHSWQL